MRFVKRTGTRGVPAVFAYGFAIGALLLLALPAGPAHANFPGHNGRIAFVSGSTIWTVAPDGGNKVPLVDVGNQYYLSAGAAWSADGARIAFARQSNGNLDSIWVANADGSNQKRLTFTDAPGFDVEPAWSPDGNKIAFLHGVQGIGIDGIYVMGADGSNPTRLTTGLQPSWSPDGTKIAFVTVPNADIGVIKPDGTGLAILVHDTRYYNYFPDWSPDGTKIVFGRGPIGGDQTIHSQIFVINVDGTNRKALTDCTSCAPDGDGAPSWSPDGTKIVFQRSHPTGGMHEADLWVMDAHGGNPVQLTTGGTSRTPSWQPTAPFTLPPPSKISVSISTPVAAGAQFKVTAVARDQWGEKLAAYNMPATWSSLDGAVSPTAPAPFVNGVSTTTAAIVTPFRDDRITLSSGGVSGQSPLFNVFGPLASFSVRLQGAVAVSAPVAVGAAVAVPSGSQFQVKAVARDAVGNSLNSYNGAATWSSLDGALTPGTPAAFVNGVSTTTATIAVPYRGDRITISSGGMTGQSGLFTVIGPLAAIRVRVATPVTHGAPFTVKATATDALGTPLPSYNAPASWSSLDGRLTPAAPSAFVNAVSTTSATIPIAFANDRITIVSNGTSAKSGLFTVH